LSNQQAIPRYLSTYVDIGVSINVDVDESKLPMPLADYAHYLVDSTNESFQLLTKEYLDWSVLDATQITNGWGQPTPVADAIVNFLSSPVVLAPRIRFVLKQVMVRPGHSDFPIDYNKPIDVEELKFRRLPQDPNYLNIWVSTLVDGLLGFGVFPFEEIKAGYGIVVDYRSTHPDLAQNPGDQSYSLNRTMPHEIGHCFGLFHTFTNPNTILTEANGGLPPADTPLPQERLGDGASQTPPQETPTRGDPLNDWARDQAVFNTAGTVVAFVNLLDYTEDPAMLALTADQVGRLEYFVQNNVRQLVPDMVDTGVVNYASLPLPGVDVTMKRLEGPYTPQAGVTQPDGDSSSTIPAWAIVLIVLGVAAVVVGIGVGVHYAHKNKKARVSEETKPLVGRHHQLMRS
jgi:hypothetical protein